MEERRCGNLQRSEEYSAREGDSGREETSSHHGDALTSNSLPLTGTLSQTLSPLSPSLSQALFSLSPPSSTLPPPPPSSTLPSLPPTSPLPSLPPTPCVPSSPAPQSCSSTATASLPHQGGGKITIHSLVLFSFDSISFFLSQHVNRGD